MERISAPQSLKVGGLRISGCPKTSTQELDRPSGNGFMVRRVANPARHDGQDRGPQQDMRHNARHEVDSPNSFFERKVGKRLREGFLESKGDGGQVALEHSIQKLLRIG